MKFYNGINPDGLICVVTGASGGLGYAISKLFLMNGIKVYMLDLKQKENEEAAYTLRNELGVSNYPIAMKVDVTNDADVRSVFSRIVQNEGKIDILINNAGIFIKKPFLDNTLDDYRNVFKVNSEGAFICAQEVYRIMQKQKDGCILNVISTGGHKGYADHAVYVPTKHALLGLTKVLSIEGEKDNIRVLAICPDAMNTKMGEVATGISDPAELRKLLQPEDTANAALFMIFFSETGRIDNISLTGRSNPSKFF